MNATDDEKALTAKCNEAKKAVRETGLFKQGDTLVSTGTARKYEVLKVHADGSMDIAYPGEGKTQFLGQCPCCYRLVSRPPG